MASGLAVFIAEKRAELAPGAEDLDWEDEWDDLTLQQQAPYIERATAVSQAPAPAPAPPPKPAVAQAPVRVPAVPPSPRPAASPAKPKPAAFGSGAGASGSKLSPMDSPSGKRKFSKSGELRKPRSAFELFASQLRRQASDSERSLDDEPPDLGQVDEERLRGIVRELEPDADLDEYNSRGELLKYCGQLLSVEGAAKWRRAEQRLEHHGLWSRLPRAEQEAYEQEATRGRAEYERAKQQGERAKAEAKAATEAKAEEVPARAAGGAKRKAPAEKALVDRSWEETCPEFGDGWTRRSRQRAGASGVDHTYVSPAGKSFPSRVKVVQHLGLASDPGSQGGRRLTEEEREARLGAKLQKEKEKVSQKQLLKEEAQRLKAQAKEKDKDKEKARKQQASAIKKGAKGHAKERLHRALHEAKEEEARQKKAGERALAEAPVGPPPPEPPGTLPLKSTALAHDFMSVWAFAGSFMSTLFLQPFSPEELCAALQRPGESVLLAELHVRLLRTLLAEFESLRKQQSPAPLDLAMLLQQVPPPTSVSSANWPELLRNLGAVLPALFSSAEFNKGSGAGGAKRDVCAEALKRLHECDYTELSLEHKLSLLRVLVDVVNNSVLLHDRTSENERTQRQLVQQHKEFEANLKKELNEARKARDEEAKHAAKQEEAKPPASAKLDMGATVEGKRRKMATAALIQAIRENDKENLLEAIEDAEQAGLSGASADGKRWATDELRAGRKLLLELREREVRKEEDGRMERKLAKQLRKHIEKMHDHSVREEPLGEDHRGRRYWFFFNDAARLWVEAPKGEVIERENGSTWAWAFYDTAAHVEMLINSLDGRGQAGEARLKSALKELQPVLSSTMVAEMAVNDNDGWLESGHEWVGQPVLRIFASVGPSTGKITKWLPADEEAGEGALFHVVHDADGDQEDLEEEEARLAIEAHREQAEAGGSSELEQPKYQNMFEQKRLRVGAHQLGVAGLRGELLDLEEMLKDGLRRAHSNWDRPDGGRALWLTSCRDSECVNELAQLLLSLEATVRALQKGEDITERPPWRTESTAHEYMGVYARRFFEGFGASDGKIVGYLPPEGEDGALWHMVHGDDKDEEDLDEHEVVFAINNYREGLTRMGEEERVYLAQYHASQAAAAEEAEDEEEDDDEDEEAAAADDDAEEEEEAWSPEASGRRGGTRSGVQRGAETQPRLPPSKIELRAAGLRPRLWNSKECRERWMHALKTVRSVASVSFALTVLRQHCQSFQIHAEVKGQPRLKRAALDQAVRCYYHSGAFGVEKKPMPTSHKKAKK